MYFFYKHPEDYKAHLTREGELKPADRAWETANNTYAFSYGLGTVELIIGFLVLAGLVSVRLGLAGAVLAFLVILAGGWLLVVDDARAILAQMARHPEAERADWNRSVAPTRLSARC
jgi:reactive chlorine resistance protein C